MKVLTTHILLSGRAILILFLLANSGFTTVLRQCEMKEAAPMECCASAGESASSPCDDSVPTSGLPAISGHSACHSTNVVGGIVGTTAVLQKATSLDFFKAGACMVRPLSRAVTETMPGRPFAQLCSMTLVSPPAVEKRVLNSSFII